MSKFDIFCLVTAMYSVACFLIGYGTGYKAGFKDCIAELEESND